MYHNKTNELTAADTSNLKIDEIQASVDARNLSTIDAAYKQKFITKNEHEYLKKFFKDGMSIFREVYRSFYETFGSPINTTGFNPKTGEIDRDQHGKTIDYSLKVLTPFICTRLKFRDKNNNSIYVFFPKMKSAERTIEKINKKYKISSNKASTDNIPHIATDNTQKIYQNMRPDFSPRISHLHDILRLTITCKYLSDVKRIKRKLSENKNEYYTFNLTDTDDRFDMPLSENKKKYYDITMIMHQHMQTGEKFDVEVQLKINTLFQGDIRTHSIYERARQIEAQSSPDDTVEMKQAQNKAIEIYNTHIKKINQNSIHLYNMMVLDKAFRVEDNDYRALRIAPDYQDGTYEKCRKFISENYMVESYDDFDPNTAFSADNLTNKMCFLKLIGALPQNFDEFSESADKKINQEFNKLDHAGRRRFQKINDVAERYQPIIQKIITSRKKHDAALFRQSEKNRHLFVKNPHRTR